MFMKTGLVKDCFAVDIKKGEMKSWNPLTQEVQLEMECDPEKREALEITGIYAVMELKDGFKKGEYWTKSKIDIHAQATSKAFGSVFWTKFYDAMAKKTVLKSLLDKWAPKSVSVAKTLATDDAVIDEPLKEENIKEIQGEVNVLESETEV
jgi:recombination protein RecT